MRRLILSSLITLTALFAYSCTAKNSSVASSPPASLSVAESPVQSGQDSSATIAQANTVAGTFQSGEHPTTGQARIVTEGNQKFIELGADFQTDPAGPDLVVALHRSSNVLGGTQPPAYSLREGDYVVIAPLQATSGSQRYDITDLNLADYASVVIWCRQFNATFGAAELTVS